LKYQKKLFENIDDMALDEVEEGADRVIRPPPMPTPPSTPKATTKKAAIPSSPKMTPPASPHTLSSQNPSTSQPSPTISYPSNIRHTPHFQGEVLREESFQKTTWKNGKGTATQFIIEPPTASLDLFDYRLSSGEMLYLYTLFILLSLTGLFCSLFPSFLFGPSCLRLTLSYSFAAKFSESCEFSNYPGCTRHLVVLEGKSLRLVDKETMTKTDTPPFKPVRFSGEDSIEGVIQEEGELIQDFNVISRDEAVVSRVNVFTFGEQFTVDGSISTFIYCHLDEGVGQAKVEGITVSLDSGSFHLKPNQLLQFTPFSSSKPPTILGTPVVIPVQARTSLNLAPKSPSKVNNGHVIVVNIDRR
jgi:environmental stress-induced protein Ves